MYVVFGVGPRAPLTRILLLFSARCSCVSCVPQVLKSKTEKYSVWDLEHLSPGFWYSFSPFANAFLVLRRCSSRRLGVRVNPKTCISLISYQLTPQKLSAEPRNSASAEALAFPPGAHAFLVFRRCSSPRLRRIRCGTETSSSPSGPSSSTRRSCSMTTRDTHSRGECSTSI